MATTTTTTPTPTTTVVKNGLTWCLFCHRISRHRQRLQLLLWFRWTILFTCATILGIHSYYWSFQYEQHHHEKEEEWQLSTGNKSSRSNIIMTEAAARRTTTITTSIDQPIKTRILPPTTVPVPLQQQQNNNNSSGYDDNYRIMSYPSGVLLPLAEHESYIPDYGGLLVKNPLMIEARQKIKQMNDHGEILDLLDLFVLSREIELRNDAMEEAAKNDASHWYESFEDLDQSEYSCRHLKWSYENHPSCNIFHEHIVLDISTIHPLQQYDIQFLDAGGYRDARLLTPKERTTTSVNEADAGVRSSSNSVVLKSLVYKRDLQRSTMREIQKEAHLFDRFQSTGLVSYLYGHCGTSVMVEKGDEIYHLMIPEETEHLSQQELAELQKDRLVSMNQLTDRQKVEIALAMAKSLATMHARGLVHADVTVYQWLRSANDQSRIMLNDVNSAEVLRWNDDKAEYCPYWASYDWGRYRAPEEYTGGYLDAAVDVWSMGHLLYGILTGLPPYHYIQEITKVHEAAQQGPPLIDLRYQNKGTFVESSIYRIMQGCFQMDPVQRISMAEVVSALERLAQAMNLS